MDLLSFGAILHWLQLTVTFYNLYLQNAWPFGSLNNTGDVGLPLMMKMPHLYSYYELQVPADRAILSIKVSSEGTDQSRVADEIKDLQDEVMSMLRPLSQGPYHSAAAPNSTQTQTVITAENAIVNLGVNTFNAFSHRKKQTLFGEKPLYEASVDVDAEFTDFDALGYVVAKFMKMPHTRINKLKWKLQDSTRETAISKCQQGAARMLMNKAKDFAEPLGMSNLRALSVNEHTNFGRAERVDAFGRSTTGGRSSSQVQLLSVDEDRVLSDSHDELDSGYMSASTSSRDESMEFEPKTLGFQVELDGDFEAW